jgi:GTP-binding protein
MSNYQKAYFLLSVADINQLPHDAGIEVAIVGRSNAGKSSILNRLAQIKRLARVSKTPGRTQHINLFGLDENRRIADLPGYGYAKAPIVAKQKWQKTVDAYIRDRQSLRGLLLVMDIRHPFQNLDKQLLDFCASRDLPVHILLNKADKLSNQAIVKTVKEVTSALTEYHNSVTLQTFSASKGTGIKELHSLLDEWYEFK